MHQLPEYINTYFSDQYTGATNAKLIRGAYHFALPDTSTGAVQANFFHSNGGQFLSTSFNDSATNYELGGWSADGITLPGALDIESESIDGMILLILKFSDNPYGDNCYGLTQSEMVSWITDFSETYYSNTSRYVFCYASDSQ
jgi:hypothetical protein